MKFGKIWRFALDYGIYLRVLNPRLNLFWSESSPRKETAVGTVKNRIQNFLNDVASKQYSVFRLSSYWSDTCIFISVTSHYCLKSFALLKSLGLVSQCFQQGRSQSSRAQDTLHNLTWRLQLTCDFFLPFSVGQS